MFDVLVAGDGHEGVAYEPFVKEEWVLDELVDGGLHGAGEVVLGELLDEALAAELHVELGLFYWVEEFGLAGGGGGGLLHCAL